MVEHLTRSLLRARQNLMRTMHEDRKHVFVDTLHWDLDCPGPQEIDQFDDEKADYLVGAARDGSHLVSVRLLDTERSHILGSIFPFLCDGEVPRGAHIKEITRYIASPRSRAGERLVARNMMARALVEYGHLTGITKYTAVCDMSFLNQILAAGWRCDPLGLPQTVDGSVVGAFCIHVERDTITKMASSWRCNRPALTGDSLNFRNAA